MDIPKCDIMGRLSILMQCHSVKTILRNIFKKLNIWMCSIYLLYNVTTPYICHFNISCLFKQNYCCNNCKILNHYRLIPLQLQPYCDYRRNI
uniref:Uncharacterized protein n=1 Tax=Anguilla anguilla TaxID=7936 RepID=A0A0E9WSK2_ANGAN